MIEMLSKQQVPVAQRLTDAVVSARGFEYARCAVNTTGHILGVMLLADVTQINYTVASSYSDFQSVEGLPAIKAKRAELAGTGCIILSGYAAERIIPVKSPLGTLPFGNGRLPPEGRPEMNYFLSLLDAYRENDPSNPSARFLAWFDDQAIRFMCANFENFIKLYPVVASRQSGRVVDLLTICSQADIKNPDAHTIPTSP